MQRAARARGRQQLTRQEQQLTADAALAWSLQHEDFFRFAGFPHGGGGGDEALDYELWVRLGEEANAGKRPKVGDAELEAASCRREGTPEDLRQPCSICMDPLGAAPAEPAPKRRRGAGPAIRELRCGHAFHAACVDTWLLQHANVTCPLCKADVRSV